jgi:hypothetical protein
VVELADTPDLGFDLLPFLNISRDCLKCSYIIDIIDQTPLSAREYNLFEKTPEVAQKVAQHILLSQQ